MRRARLTGQARVNQWVSDQSRKFEYPFQEIPPFPAQGGGRGGAPTVVVAASNATEISKGKADLICTGVNDHTVIQQALNMVDTGSGLGGRVLLTEGTFNVDGDQIRLSDVSAQAPTQLEGLGWNTILLMQSAGSCIEMNADGNMVRNLRVKGEFTGDTGIEVDVGNDFLLIENVWLEDLNAAAIALGAGVNDMVITKAIVDVALHGITSPSNAIRLLIDTCDFLTDQDGIQLASTGHSDIAILGNLFNVGRHGLHLPSTEVEGLVFSDNIVRATTDGVNIDADRVRIEGNTFIPTGNSAVNIEGGECNIVVGNAFGDCDGYTTDCLIDNGANTQLFYPADATYGDNFTDCGTGS